MIYIKTNNKIEAITPNPIWLNDKPDDSSEYDWNCQRYILTLAAAMRLLSEASTLEAFEAQELEQAKDNKIAQITPARDAFMYANIEYNGSLFTNSQVSGNNLTAEIATQTALIEWLDSSGNQVDLTLEQAKELSTLIKAKRRTAYFKEATLLAQINACQTLEELENININF
jgi:tRNA A37 threonylcarbamoyladenosine modification protein TsaB